MKNSLVSRVLSEIPGVGEPHVPMVALASRHVPHGGECRAFAECLETLLRLFGVLESYAGDDKGEHGIRARSDAAAYFIRSIALQLDEGIDLLSDWNRSGAHLWPGDVGSLFRGPQFLYLMETLRHQRDPTAIATRQTTVAKILIKRSGGRFLRRADRYLMQYDRGAQALQLIGGHQRPSDTSLEETAAREVAEELPGAGWTAGLNYSLVQLTTVELQAVSLTAGALTNYSLTYFHLKSPGHRLVITPPDRWVSESELLKGVTRDGTSINEPAIKMVDRELARRLRGLESSL